MRTYSTGLLVALLAGGAVQAGGPVDIRTVAQPMTGQVFGSGPETDYQQADGVVQVVTEPNRGRSRTVRFISTKAVRGVIAGRIVLPNGESFGLEKFDLDRCCGPTMIIMELWSGDLPQSWPYGLTRFDVYNLVDGRTLRTSAYVDVSSGGMVPEPNIGNIGVVQADQGRQVLVSPGPYKSGSSNLAIVVGFVPADRFAINQLGQLAITVPADQEKGGMSAGHTTVTICEAGLCGTRTFFYNPLPPSLPPGPG